ncbi:hypothetical protein GCM10018987_24080 [Streptomyces cremeus]
MVLIYRSGGELLGVTVSNSDVFEELKRERAKILEESHSQVLRLQEEVSIRLLKVTRKAAKVAKESGGIPCLVRWTPGPELTIYHSADSPCGRVRDRHNFRRLSEKAARDASPYAYLDRCSACSWPEAAVAYGKRMLEWK